MLNGKYRGPNISKLLDKVVTLHKYKEHLI